MLLSSEIEVDPHWQCGRQYLNWGSVSDSSWNMMAHGDAREGKWRGNWRMQWVASTLHTTSERGVSSITTGDVHASAGSIWLNWLPRWFKWTRPFRRKTKSGFCACTITFQLASTTLCRTYCCPSFRLSQYVWHKLIMVLKECKVKAVCFRNEKCQGP